MPTIEMDGNALTDWPRFYDAFARAFGFPDFFGRNLDAWIDCMTSLDCPEDGLTSVHGSATDPVVIKLQNASGSERDLRGVGGVRRFRQLAADGGRRACDFDARVLAEAVSS